MVVDNQFNSTTITPEVQHWFTQGVGYMLFAVYNIMAVTVLMNMLIAMMSNSLNTIAVSKIGILIVKFIDQSNIFVKIFCFKLNVCTFN